MKKLFCQPELVEGEFNNFICLDKIKLTFFARRAFISFLKKKNFSAIIFFTVVSFAATEAQSQTVDSIIVQLNKTTFNKNDTINFEVTLPNYKQVAKTATIQLWIEELKTGKRWKYRYPLINGYINAKLIVDSSLIEGNYAFNFLLQKNFFLLNGNVVNATSTDKLLNYMMIMKDKETMVDFAPVNAQGNFSLHNLLFKDTAYIIFSKPKQKKNDLLIKVETPLDSAFTTLASSTKFISVGMQQKNNVEDLTNTNNYTFNTDSTKFKITLKEVIIKTKYKKRLEDFDKENTTGLFTGSDAIVLDGISSDEIANTPDLYIYLATKIGGVKLETDNATGAQYFTWRNLPVNIFINEIRLDTDMPLMINPADIAMIKVFRPGTSITGDSGGGGAIAIYTKTSQYEKSTNRNYGFYIVGYTGMEAIWK